MTPISIGYSSPISRLLALAEISVRRPKQRFVVNMTWILLAAGLIVRGLSCAPIPDEIGLSNGTLRACPQSPNCVVSENSRSESHVDPLTFKGDGPRSFQSLIKFLSAEPGVDLVTVEDGYAHAVFRTPILRFQDDIELRLDPGLKVIHVRSASRIGYSDLGANRRRIESIRRRWHPPTDE